MKAIEVNGRIDKRHTLRIEGSLTGAPPGRVRVIILVPEDSDIDEDQWLRSAASNTAFDFLRDPAEDVYTVRDGKPLADEG